MIAKERSEMSIQDHILHAIDAAAERVIEVSRQIHDHPEPCFQEHFAANTLTGALETFGIAAQTPTGGLETAFRAEFGCEARPKVAILAEYDALPNGHACGHNLIAGAALGAAVGLADDELKATMRHQIPCHDRRYQ
jgi:metal-dependent amidase/aminoacylase/carboxypeptidase family protein